MRRVTVCIALGLTACQAPPPEGIAHWRGGHLEFEALEAEARRRLPRTPGGVEQQEVLASYRRVAEEMALRGLLEADAEAVDAVTGGWRQVLATLELQAVAEVYAAGNLPRAQITEAEVEAYYHQHADELMRRERRSILHIFKRQRPGVDSLAVLGELRRRALAGERFEDLARESDSETRLMDGRLGWVERGKLAPALERVVFALGAGEISEPLPVPGGGVMIQVREVENEERLSLDDVRQALAQRLVSDRFDELVRDHVGDLGEAATVLEGGEIGAALRQAEPDDVVLAAGDYSLTATGFRRFVVERTSGNPQQDVVEIYRGLARALLLTLAAEDSGFPSTEAERQRLAEARRVSRDAFLARKLLQGALDRRIRGDEEVLRAYFERNAGRYRSQLALRLELLVVEDLAAGPVVMPRLEALRRQAESGSEIDLEATAAEIGGEVSDLGWLEFAALQALPPKVRLYLFEVTGTGLTVPFQYDDSLRIIEIVERREPAALSFEQARGAVLRDYTERHGQEVFRQLLDERLAEVDFVFDEAELHARLWPAWANE